MRWGIATPSAAVSVRSLRARVTAVAVAMVAVALVASGVAVEVVLAAQLRRDADARLDDRLTRATLLVDSGTPASQLPDALDGAGIRTVVLDARGAVVAGRLGGPHGRDRSRGGPDRADGTETSEGAVPAGTAERFDDGSDLDGAGRAGAEGTGRAGGGKFRVLGLPDGGRVVLRSEPGAADAVLDRLRTVLIAVGVLGLAAVAAALLVGVPMALRPLTAMAALARDIAGGERGRRLHPPRTDTEIGRTAAAFDDMLDALEAAQTAAEAAQNAAEAAAEEARRSEATTRRFLSDAAHELRTPIAGVQTLAETLVRRPDADLERRERIATTLVRETRRAAALVGDMLELARLEGADTAGADIVRRPMDLAEAAATAAERVALVAGDLDVGTEAPSPVPVEADPSRIAQILANLLDNARRHSPAGGRITVEVGHGPDGAARLDVVDEGPGVPDAERERVFDRLVRLDDARTRDAGGAGLGLSIARALARAHGGDLVAVASEAGARFRLTLPPARP